MQPPPAPSSIPEPPAGKAVLKAGSICFLVAVISIIAQPILLAFIHGPLMAVSIVLAIIAIAKDQVKRGVQLLLASIFMLPMIFALSLFLWFVGIGAFIAGVALYLNRRPRSQAIHDLNAVRQFGFSPRRVSPTSDTRNLPIGPNPWLTTCLSKLSGRSRNGVTPPFVKNCTLNNRLHRPSITFSMYSGAMARTQPGNPSSTVGRFWTPT
jgi:hypothetical protein